MKKSRTLSIFDLCQIAIFTAFITVCSWISIPFAIPVTLQIFGVFTACAYLGTKRGVLCVLAYIALGAAGAPVFSNFRGGVGHLFSESGGFIVGFLFCAVIIGLLMRNKRYSFKTLFFSILIALFGCYFVGIVWFLFITIGASGTNNLTVTLLGFIPIFLIDIIKILIAALILPKLKRMGEAAINGR